jgi:DNA (cytosine-5)-methyltransferase 1
LDAEGEEAAEEAGEEERQMKPPYRVPSMAEIARIKWNGLTVIDLFSGCGGSCLGFRMAGFRVLWANEFVPIAQESYRANMRRGTILDGRDVRTIKAEEILAATGLKVGELDCLSGSPPCQAFSSAGTRDKGWGKNKKYVHGAEQKNEELFSEFVRLRDGLKPRAFVAENVSGLVKGKAKGFFLEILRELKRGYRVEARLLDAQWLGVPQQRVRVIFVGVRDDLGLEPAFPDPLPYRYSVRDALPWIGGATHDTGRKGQQAKDITGRPAPTITSGPDDVREGGGPRNHFKVEGVVNDQRGNRGSKTYGLDRPAPTITAGLRGSGPHDLQLVGREVEPETDISRYAIGAEYDKLNPGQQSEKYFNLIKADASEPSPTIMSSSGAYVSGAAVMHPTEKRRFSILEVKRLCSFPDDFELKGSFAAQWERLGNSVPPIMMKKIAEAIRDRVLLPARVARKSSTKPSEPRTRRASSRRATPAGASPGGHNPSPART